MAALLQVDELNIRFGASHAVRGIRLQINEGEVLGLVGESGSGKSATSLAIMGLLGAAAQTSGSILWRGSGEPGIDLLRPSPATLRPTRRPATPIIFQHPIP